MQLGPVGQSSAEQQLSNKLAVLGVPAVCPDVVSGTQNSIVSRDIVSVLKEFTVQWETMPGIRVRTE